MNGRKELLDIKNYSDNMQTTEKRKNLAVDLLDKEVRKKYLHTEKH